MLLIARLGIALLLAAGASCSSDDGHRDRNYGTDAGAGYQLPDGGARDSAPAEVSVNTTSDASSALDQAIGQDVSPRISEDASLESSQDVSEDGNGDGAAGAAD